MQQKQEPSYQRNEQYVHLFPQNEMRFQGVQPAPSPKRNNRNERTKKRRLFTLWNLFAVIGMITVIVQAIRYLIIPLLVYLNSVTGGVL